MNYRLNIGGTAREHEALMARNIMSNHPDMQDKHCGDCYSIHPIQSQCTKVSACGRHLKRVDAARPDLLSGREGKVDQRWFFFFLPLF